MKKKGTKGFTTVVLLLVIVGLLYFTYLNNNAGTKRNVTEKSETEKLLNYDFVNDYPKTVRETVKLHCRYLQNAYNGVFSEDELFTVNNQIRQLFDEELLEYNSQEAQLRGLKDEIQLYADSKQRFTSYSLSEASQIQYNTENGIEYAKMKVTIVLKVAAGNISVNEEYILRKDQQERWKILGWQIVGKDAVENKGE